MTDDQWVKSRAKVIVRQLDPVIERTCENEVQDALAAFANEAIERVETRNREAGDFLHYHHGRQSVIDHLRNPDEAIRRAMEQVNYGPAEPDLWGRYCRAIADVLQTSGTAPSVVDRLRDPDEALKEAMRDAAVIAMVPVGMNLKTALRRIADALEKGVE